MSLIIRKYGGSSISSAAKIKIIAKHIKDLYQSGHKIILVVSAMGKSTDELLNSANEITSEPNYRELDMLLSIGERKSISLVSLALIDINVPAVSLTGSQIGLITDHNHGNAQIIEIKGDRIEQALSENKVVVVAGYQGVSTTKEITTLGRGGTDTTAIALAARFDADRCELMKDVDGLYSVPPDFIHDSYLRKYINFKELLNFSDAGLQLISKEAIKIAYQSRVKLSIGNTYSNEIGTNLIENDEQKTGITQIIEKNCYLSKTKLKNEKSDKIILIEHTFYYMYFEPILNKQQKDHCYISIFGNNLFEIDIINHIESSLLKFSYISDEKIEFLFELENYNIHKKEIYNFLKPYINK